MGSGFPDYLCYSSSMFPGYPYIDNLPSRACGRRHLPSAPAVEGMAPNGGQPCVVEGQLHRTLLPSAGMCPTRSGPYRSGAFFEGLATQPGNTRRGNYGVFFVRSYVQLCPIRSGPYRSGAFFEGLATKPGNTRRGNYGVFF